MIKHNFTPTTQQQTIINTICTAHTLSESSIITVDAVAGASKSTTLQLTASEFHRLYPSALFRYIVFGRLNYEEARTAFGTTAICSTVHQIAYEYMITKGRMKLVRNSNYLSWKEIPKYIKQPFGRTTEAFNHIDEFCRDSSISLSDYCSYNDVDYIMESFLTKLFEAMYAGHMPCTHDVYLKCFHIDLINGHIQLSPVDILAVDEVQDLSHIMLDLIRLYPAKVKVLVGDPYQSIFSFMNCINAFKYFPDATRLHLSQSFRCSTEIADRVQSFVHNTFDPDFQFEGFNYTSQPITTKAILTRTNAALIAQMIRLNKLNIPYRLSNTAKLTQMFEWPLALLRCTPGNKELNPKFKPVQVVVDEWAYKHAMQQTSLSRIKYIMQEFPENKDIVSSMILLTKFSAEDIINAYKHAKEHQKSSAPLSLMTIHTSKGSTFDEVEFDDDINESIVPTMEKIIYYKKFNIPLQLSADELESLYLYYVAATRCRYKITNAKYL